MTLIRHELKRAWKSLTIWTCAIGAFIVICLFMYPEMKTQTEAISSLFSSMGAFTAAFGLDVLDFGSLKGFYGIECGNILNCFRQAPAALHQYEQMIERVPCAPEENEEGRDNECRLASRKELRQKAEQNKRGNHRQDAYYVERQIDRQSAVIQHACVEVEQEMVLDTVA